jgi:hypothetical protein
MGGEYIEDAFVHAAHGMRGKYTLVDVKTFLNYLPNPSTNMPSVDKSSFAKVPSPRETEMYKPLVSCSSILVAIALSSETKISRFLRCVRF